MVVVLEVKFIEGCEEAWVEGVWIEPYFGCKVYRPFIAIYSNFR